MLSERFYGVGEPLIQREGDTKVAAEAYLDLVKAMGCSAYRSWMHLTEVLTDPVTPNTEKVEAHTRLLNRAKELNLEVTGMSHEWFLPEGCQQRTGHAVPKRDLTEGSLYRQTLEMMEETKDALIEAMHTPWVRFTKTGEPDPENWPKYDGYNTEIRIFDRKTITRLVRRKELMEVWGDLRFYED